MTGSNSARVNQLQTKIQYIKQDLAENDKTKKEKIREWAENLKELVDLGAIDIKKQDIVKRILKEIEQMGLDIGKSTVYYSVPADCKENYEVDNEKLDTEGIYSSNSNDGITTIVEFNKPVEKMDHGEAYDAKKKLEELKAKKRAEMQYINDQEDRLADIAEKNNWTDITKGRVKSTPKEEPRITRLHQAWERAEVKVSKMKEKAFEFPPAIEDEEFYAQAVDQLFSIFDPMIDEKWSADWMSDKGWLEIEKYNVIHGKHAAAVKFGGQTINGTYRPLTREEVGDQYEEVVEATRKFYNAIPGIAAVGDWYNTYAKPRILARKENLSQDLSDKA